MWPDRVAAFPAGCGSQQIGRLALQRFTGAGQMTRTRRDARGGEARRFQRGTNLPQADTGEAWIGIHRIFVPGDVAGREELAQLVACQAEQGADQREVREAGHGIGGNGAHCRKAVEAAAAGQTQEKGFGLIVLGVGDVEERDLPCAAPFAHEAIARLARRGFNIGFGFCALPRKHGAIEPERFGLGFHIGGMVPRTLCEAVIDGENFRGRPFSRARPIGREMHQCEGISAAGNGDGAGPEIAQLCHRGCEARGKRCLSGRRLCGRRAPW